MIGVLRKVIILVAYSLIVFELIQIIISAIIRFYRCMYDIEIDFI